MRRFLLYLRFTFSITCVLACGLLIALWVHSLYTGTVLSAQITRTHAFRLVSQRGFWGMVLFNPSEVPRGYYKWGLRTERLDRFADAKWDIGIRTQSDNYVQIMLPCWFVVLIVAATSLTALRVEWRFSLRTLLIDTTLVAAELGAIAHAVR